MTGTCAARRATRAVPEWRRWRKAKDANQDTNRTDRSVELILKEKPNFMTIHLGLTDEAQHEHGPFSPQAIGGA